MKSQLPAILERGRIRAGHFASDESFGWNGAFKVKGPRGLDLFMIIADGAGWEHVSISVIMPNKNVKQRDPGWDEMCFVKDLVWEEEECVIQYHPPKSNYKNVHPHVLHLWRPIGQEIPMPPLELV